MSAHHSIWKAPRRFLCMVLAEHPLDNMLLTVSPDSQAFCFDFPETRDFSKVECASTRMRVHITHAHTHKHPQLSTHPSIFVSI